MKTDYLLNKIKVKRFITSAGGRVGARVTRITRIVYFFDSTHPLFASRKYVRGTYFFNAIRQT
jgi:hypothetical protein